MSTLRCVALAIEGAFRLEPQPVEDERGGFARLWCRDTLRAAGLDEARLAVMQTSASFNRRAGTLRGLHFAWPPAQEAKVVRCARGRMLDLRPGSPTWLRHVAVELDADTRQSLVVPAGEQPMSLSSPGCLPVSRTILAEPMTAWAAQV